MNLMQDRTQEIKKELAELNQSLKMTVQKAIRIGELLTEQKEFVGHGKFLSWLDDNLDISDKTAEKYMKLFTHHSKIELSTNLQEAYQQIETIERQERMSEDERRRALIAEYRKTGKKPAGWDRSLDYTMQKEKEYLKRQEEQRRTEEETRKKNREERERQKIEDDLFEQSLSILTDKVARDIQKRQTWKEKIRLSDSGKDDAFMDAIIDYLETLADDNRRIEACNNIIKICRNISVELQKVKTA